MRRGVSLVAAGITAFALVMLVSVVYAYGAMAAPRPVQQASAVGMAVSDRSGTSDRTTEQVSPSDAAALAGTLLRRSDAYSVELAEWNGVPAYKVTFSSGDVAFISLDGKLLAAVPFNTYFAFSGGGGGGGGGAGGIGQARADYDHEDGQEAHELEHQDEPQEPQEAQEPQEPQH